MKITDLRPGDVSAGMLIRVTKVAPSEAEAMGYVDDTERLLGQEGTVEMVRTGTYAQLFVNWNDPTIKLTLAGDDEIEILSFCEECGEEEHATKDCPHIAGDIDSAFGYTWGEDRRPSSRRRRPRPADVDPVDPDYPDGIYIQEGYEGE